MTPEQTTDSKIEYAKYVKSVLADQERYDRQQRLSETGFCIPPITIRPELISEQEFISRTTDSKEVAR